MGKMKDKLIDIQECLQEGYRPESVAAMLNVPIDWVWQVYQTMENVNEVEYGDLK